ncbi:unnamed protein product, partial [Hapterophycus canaliculatus]
MAQFSPLVHTGSPCDFCNTSPATLVIRGRLVCERHKKSEIIEVGFSSYPPSSAARLGGVKKSENDEDDDVIEAWEPPAVTAGQSTSSPPPNFWPVSGTIDRRSSPNGINPGSSSSRPFSSSTSAPLVGPSSLASPTASLAASPEPTSNVDDDVEVVGISPGPGFGKLMGASPPVLPVDAVGFGSTGEGGSGVGRGGHGESKGLSIPNRGHRRRRTMLAGSAGTQVVDLATAADVLSAAAVGASEPRRKRRNSSPGGAGISGGSQEQQQLRRSGSDEAADKDAPVTAEQKNRKRQKFVRPEVLCIVCFDSSPVDRSARCAEGHAMCKTCVTTYITETLMPQGTVFWDRIKCGGSSTCGYLFGPSVTSVLPHTVIQKV